jgi:hypothetical protein
MQLTQFHPHRTLSTLSEYIPVHKNAVGEPGKIETVTDSNVNQPISAVDEASQALELNCRRALTQLLIRDFSRTYVAYATKSLLME